MTAFTWLKYCRYGVKHYLINQSINFEIVKCKHIEEHVHNVAYFTNNYCLPCVVFLFFFIHQICHIYLNHLLVSLIIYPFFI